MRFLNEFIHKQEVDVLLLHEVPHTDFEKIRGYKAHINVGIHKRGTAILTREQIALFSITRLPSGRRIAACYRGVWFVNLYAPSGTANIQEREDFHNVELVYLLRPLPPTMIVGVRISTASCHRRTVPGT